MGPISVKKHNIFVTFDYFPFGDKTGIHGKSLGHNGNRQARSIFLTWQKTFYEQSCTLEVRVARNRTSIFLNFWIPGKSTKDRKKEGNIKYMFQQPLIFHPHSEPSQAVIYCVRISMAG